MHLAGRCGLSPSGSHFDSHRPNLNGPPNRALDDRSGERSGGAMERSDLRPESWFAQLEGLLS